MSLITGFLDIVENALRNPTDKAAVQIAIDGLAAWKDISTHPTILKLEADIGAYVATLPKGAVPAVPAPADQSAPQRTQTPSDFNRWQAEHPPK